MSILSNDPRRTHWYVPVAGLVLMLALFYLRGAGESVEPRRARDTPPGLEHANESAAEVAPAAIDPTLGPDATENQLLRLSREIDERMPRFAFSGIEMPRVLGRGGRVAVFLHERTGLKFSLVLPAFETDSHSAPEHEPTITAPYLLCTTECTNAAWSAVSGIDADRSRYPVAGKTWTEVSAWCEAAGLRLPTEAEWVHAFSVGIARWFDTGDDHVIDTLGWFEWNRTGLGLRAAAEKHRDLLALHDMLGNAWEFCSDAYVPTESFRRDKTRSDTARSMDRVIRGGGIIPFRAPGASLTRSGVPQTDGIPYVGFRPACSIPGTVVTSAKNE